MRHEYETVARAGFILQLDCPDLAMGPHIQCADETVAQLATRPFW
jgi:5-methyltetrahydropteroyltriglutamate--homocysteine methyltransferase